MLLMRAHESCLSLRTILSRAMALSIVTRASFDAEKEIEGEKNKNIFELIEKGALITKGELFKYFNQLIG